MEKVILFSILLGFIPALIAHINGRSFGLWWIYGALLFIVALFHSILMKPNQSELKKRLLSKGLKKCLHCEGLNKADSNVCRYCDGDL
jgi:hypothetical protein